MCPLQVIFEHEGVFIHPGSDEDGIDQDLMISGSLRIVEKVSFFFPLSVIGCRNSAGENLCLFLATVERRRLFRCVRNYDMVLILILHMILRF